ncbi:MAG TPA: energy transducer TonB [Longimicrobiaceae bacterium]|nr:energy transducer TonB [Longimicrobiaceae bacterium]
MKPLASALLGLFACAAPLAAQDAPRARTLLPLLSAAGITLSLDSASIGRTGDSTFVMVAVYQGPVDTAGTAPDRREEVQELDCARNRVRDRVTSYYRGEGTLPVRPPEHSATKGWEPVDEGELPIHQAICQYLTGGWAARLPKRVEQQPELANAAAIRRALTREYPHELRDRGIGGTVQVRFRLLPDGMVDPATIDVVESTDPRFAEPARRVAAQMRFRPAAIDHRPVAVWVVVPLTFYTFAPQPDPAAPPRP